MAKLSELTIDLSIGNIEETVSELKRVQREAKKATQAIRELETMYESEGKRYYTKWNQTTDGEICFNIYEVCLTDIPTEYLQRELAKRADFETKEGSVINLIATELGVPPSDLVKLEPAEISYLFASIKNK